MENIKSLFLLDPKVTFLNHGSFGATPSPVFSVYQEWQRHIESQPVRFFVNEFAGRLAKARHDLGHYVNASHDNIVYIPNATFALNIIARSLNLAPNDVVLTTDHEYGACDNIWHFLSQKQGFTYKQQTIPLPIESDKAIVEQFWEGVSSDTKVIFLSHISSATAITFPIEEICQRARAEGILTIIDGAHAPGQIPLDMALIGADFYFGNAHKWLCSPKGAAFLFARRDVQAMIEPLVVSWGWRENDSISYGSDFLDYLQWSGTDDISAYLSVPAAIEFQERYNWAAVRKQCHVLLQETLSRITKLTGLASPYPNDTFYHQMAVAPLPYLTNIAAFKTQLYDEFCVEIPCTQWQDHQFIRISIQGYNSQEDVETLLNALQQLLPATR
ncbi:MAG: aminotransferase class V-fold PLP-dependent enzyme [Chloroflexi bacterium]|nr:aminotransferase class V-fold PLP-dependent enzyme [Chloroflexota bacterium]